MLVTVKDKFQIVIPQDVRRKVGIAVGDLLEATVERGHIKLVPKAVIDRSLARGLADLEAGRSHGPYRSVSEAISGLARHKPKETNEISLHRPSNGRLPRTRPKDKAGV
jgi:AbrB family looped-hinge helix DNA binding protein